VSARIERRRRHKKHGLSLYKPRQLLVNFRIRFPHGYP
jgi:hypothetical protein